MHRHACRWHTIFQSWSVILDEVGFQAEHAVRDYFFVTQRPSTVALAAILNAINQVDEEHDRHAITRALSFFMSEEFESLEVILTSINRLHILVYGREASDGNGDAASVVFSLSIEKVQNETRVESGTTAC